MRVRSSINVPNVILALLQTEISSDILVIFMKEKKYKYSICKKGFSKKCHSVEHLSSVHENKKEHQCFICKSYFKSQHYLKGHMSSVHEGYKQFKCQLCDSTFS